MIWRVFRKSRPAPRTESWWRDAERTAEAPTTALIDALQARATHPSDDLDEAERQEEMVDGLRQMLAMSSAAELPVIVTQHRVIGVDRCHFVAPVSLAGEVGAPGKLFITNDRLVFAGGRVQAWPWHRVRDLIRHGRMVTVVLNGGSEGVSVQCNTYGDALLIRHLTQRLKTGPKTQPE